ncbi:MAG: hypothetical protein AAGA03_13995 [Planctomycetota bacterium]
MATADTVHADKYNDPRVQFRWRWVAVAAVVLLFAAATAVLSIYARRTPLEKSTEFWGPETITALQLADKVELHPGEGQEFEPVELTGTPGLGHLRHALLNERHYLWDTRVDGPIADQLAADQDQMNVTLQFADPHGKRVPITRIDLELNSGWVGPEDGSRSVRVNDRVQPALRHQLKLMMSVTQKTYDRR